MIIICGKTIAEVERDLEMAKQAIASGMPYGIGGENIADVEKAMEMLHSAVGGAVAPISNPNYIAPTEDEDETCPNCGEVWDGCYCDCCGYDPDYEDECCDCDECDCECGHSCCKCECEDEPCGVCADDVDKFANAIGLPKIMVDELKKILGL